MQYDVTVHNISEEEKDLVCQVLADKVVKYTVGPAEDAALEYLGANCKPKLAVSAVVDRLLKSPKATKAALRWSGSMANKFLRLAGVWDTLGQAEKNVILGYEVAPKPPGWDDPLPDPRDPGGGY